MIYPSSKHDSLRASFEKKSVRNNNKYISTTLAPAYSISKHKRSQTGINKTVVSQNYTKNNSNNHSRENSHSIGRQGISFN